MRASNENMVAAGGYRSETPFQKGLVSDNYCPVLVLNEIPKIVKALVKLLEHLDGNVRVATQQRTPEKKRLEYPPRFIC